MRVSFDGAASTSTTDVLASGATAFVMPIGSIAVDAGPTTLAASVGTGTALVAGPSPTPIGGTTTTVEVDSAARADLAKPGLEKLVPVDSPAAQKKALPKWVVPVGIAVLVIVAAFAAYKLWFTGKAAA